MGSRLDRHLAALCVPMDPDRLLDDLAVNDGGATTSSYTEAGPRPGASTPDQNTATLTPVVSGGQGVDLELAVLAPGAPGLSTDGGAALGYRFSGETDAQIRGWSPPNLLLGWSAPLWSDSTTYDDFDLVTLPNQKVVLLYRDGSSAKVKVWNPATAAWGSATTITTSSYNAIAAVVNPSNGRIIAGLHDDAWISDDDGATWSQHSRSIYSASKWGLNWDRLRMVWTNGSILALALETADLTQLASDDDLGTLTEVATIASFGTKVSAAAHPNGSFVVGYLRNSDGYFCVRILSSAWESLDDATEIVVGSVAGSEAVIVADPDGLLWSFVTSSAAKPDVYVRVSVDGGQTWSAFEDGALLTSTTGDYVTNLAATSAGGAVHLAHNWVASAGNEDGSIGVAILGGWGTLTSYPQADTTTPVELYPREGLLNRTGGGPSLSGTIAHDNCTWIPIERPAETNLYTGTGTGTATLTAGELLIGDSGSPADNRYYTRDVGASIEPRCMIAEMRYVTGSGDSTSDDCIILMRQANGASDYRMKLRISASDVVLRDPNAGSTLASLSIDTTSPIQFAFSGDVTGTTVGWGCWYRRPYETEWTELWSGTLTNGGTPAATALLEWGHETASQDETGWKFVLFAEGLLGHDPGPFTEIGVGGLKLGRPITPTPIPLHPETGDGTNVAWLSAVAGSASLEETWTVEADHDYPVEHLLPTVSPSPDERWRSTGTGSDVIVAWDAGDETWIGDSVALPALACNFRQALLEYYNGSIWVTVGTLDLATGFTSLSYSLAGDCMIPDTSTTSGARYLQEGELAGGHVVIGSNAYKIRWNTAGVWVSSSGATTPLARILLDGDLSGESATGTVNICWPHGVLVVHGSSIVRARRWRVKIASGQATAEGYYESGGLVPMAVRAIGQAPAWGWSREAAPNADTRRSRYGTTRVKKRGPPPASLTWGWTDGVMLDALRDTTQPDYLGSSAGMPLTAAGDVPWLLRGLLERTDSGATPVVALSAVPNSSGTTITDRTLWLYGRLSGSVREDNVMGVEGSSEVQRVATITVEGLV